ncbi:MAG: type I restriction enzyme HsdR N-terminal domain-containing protein [Lachnospiraceae bacterium]|nr:type I restriction enzyme HsdR N-terminal domain-containing protein [Lachnospiraceae bacterium]
MNVTSFSKRFKIKQKDGKLYDPIRKKYVQAKPEEYVRQKTIRFLIDCLEVPSDRIVVECALSTLGVEGDKRRIDIGILDPENSVAAVVECKCSLVGHNEPAFIQAQDYLMDLHARYFFVTDGMIFKGYLYRYMCFEQLEEIPGYEELLSS